MTTLPRLDSTSAPQGDESAVVGDRAPTTAAASGPAPRGRAQGTRLLEVADLEVKFVTDGGEVSAVNGVSFSVDAGETLVILGESGSGKSVTAQAILGVVPSPPGFVTRGSIRLKGVDLLTLPKAMLRQVRGRDVALIFQDALTSLNPRFTVGYQIAETIRVHSGASWASGYDRAAELLASVGIPAPRERLNDYPHQFSGGMRQRALIAMAIALRPSLLIADEPTTALDVTVQAQVLDLLQRLQREAGMGMVLITHDLSVARAIADRVGVMYAGRLVEYAPVTEIFVRPAHPYTVGLMRSSPRASRRGEPLLPIKGSPPDLRHIPPGCPFHPRCWRAEDVCRAEVPHYVELTETHVSACHFAREVAGNG